MAYQDAKLVLVKRRFVDALSVALGVNTAVCYLSNRGLDKPPNFVQDAIYRVRTRGGAFDESYLDGGGTNQTTASVLFEVQIWTKTKQDERGHATELMGDAVLGSDVHVSKVLAAMNCRMLLADDNSTELLRHPLLPKGWEETPDFDKCACVSLLFEAVFDWDLAT